MNVIYIKWLGLISATIAGATLAIAGDPVTGGGIIASALSSAGVLFPQQ